MSNMYESTLVVLAVDASDRAVDVSLAEDLGSAMAIGRLYKNEGHRFKVSTYRAVEAKALELGVKISQAKIGYYWDKSKRLKVLENQPIQ